MRKARRWLAWKFAAEKKPPVGKDGKAQADWNSPSQWLSYEDALDRAASVGDGVGFVLGAGFGGLDFDDCRSRETGTLDPRARGLLALMPTADAEVWPSGKGIKVFGRAQAGWSATSATRPTWWRRAGTPATSPSRASALYGREALPDLPFAIVLQMLRRAPRPRSGAQGGPSSRARGPRRQEPALFREAAACAALGTRARDRCLAVGSGAGWPLSE